MGTELHKPGIRAAMYVRVSTEDQVLGGSLDTQKRLILGECSRRDWELVDAYSDHSSGKSMLRRPGLNALLARLDAGEVDALVVSRLDRLSRSVWDTYGIMERATKLGWSLVCLDPDLDMTTASGRLFAGMAALFAQYERELIAQRQKDSIAARKAAGTYKAPKPQVSPLVEQRIEYLTNHGLTLRAIAEQLTLEGHEPPRSEAWNHQTVAAILKRIRMGGPLRGYMPLGDVPPPDESETS